MNPLFHTEFSISDSLKNVRKSVLIYETIILEDSFQNMVSRGLANGMHVGRIITMDGLK